MVSFRSTNSNPCGDQSPPGFIGKMDGGIGNLGVYSRVPYDSWPFNAMSGAHTGIKPDVSGFDYVSEQSIFWESKSSESGNDTGYIYVTN